MSFTSLMKKLFGGGTEQESANCSAAECCCSEKKSSPAVAMKDLEGFVNYVVRALVDNPDEVNVSTKTEGDEKVIWISCRKEDTGKIIGKKGKTIIALRALVAGAAGRMQNRVKVEVAD